MSLVSQIEHSKSNEAVENEVHSAYKEAESIMRLVEKSGNTELIEKFKKEYQDLQNSIRIALQEDRAFSISERSKIKLELSDMLQMAENNDISTKYQNGTFNNIRNWFQGVKKERLNATIQESLDLRKKDIKDMSIEEAQGALLYLNEGYTQYANGALSLTDEETIEDLKDKKDVEAFQERLIIKILPEKQDSLKFYDKKIGYTLIKISDMEALIKNTSMSQIDGKSINSYIELLFKKEPDEKKVEQKLRDTFGYTKTKKLLGYALQEGKLNTLKETQEQRQEIDRKISQVNRQLHTLKNKAEKLMGQELYKKAFIEELNIQNKEVQDAYQKYQNDEISYQQIFSEINDIDILFNVTGLGSALTYGAEYYTSAMLTDDIPELKNILKKMNIIYIAAMANDVSLTDEFKDKRDEISKKIITKEGSKEKTSYYHEVVGNIQYNSKKIEQQIQVGNYENINKYELYAYIENIDGKMSKSTINILLKKFPRNFIRYISNEFLGVGGIMSALVANNKDFLESLKNISHIIDMDQVVDMVGATRELSKSEIEEGKKILDNKDEAQEFLKKLSEASPLQLNKVIIEWREYIFQKELQDKKEYLGTFLNTYQIQNLENTILIGNRQGLGGDKLTEFILKNTKSIPKKAILFILDIGNKGDEILAEELKKVTQKNNFSQEKNNSLKEIHEKIKKSHQETQDRIELLEIVDEKEFQKMNEILQKGGTLDEVDTYISQHNTAYQKKKQEQQIRRKEKEENEKTQGNNLSGTSLEESGGNFYIHTPHNQKQKIQITQEEKKIIGNNPEALKNLINFHDYFNNQVNLPSVWKYRHQILKSIGDFTINTTDDSINKSELTKIANYILQLIHGKDQPNLGDITQITPLLRKYSQFNLDTEKNYGIEGYDRLEYDLRQKGVIHQAFGFQQNHAKNLILTGGILKNRT